jgi:glycosyltransferase involved in cell wall biosynthesis
MKICFFLAGLPGSSYHGGAVTCWAVLREMINEGHEVEILSLYDESDFNPYLKYRSNQEDEIKELGVKINYINCDIKELSLLKSKFSLLFLKNRLEFAIPWAKLGSKVKHFFEQNKYESIFCYHFEPVAALYNSKANLKCKVVAGLGDLLFEPYYYRLKFQNVSVFNLNGFIKWMKFYLLKTIQVNIMKHVLSNIDEVGFFANHYANWYQTQTKKYVHYFRTPTHDPTGSLWRERRNNLESKKFKILFIGELNTTVATVGLDEFINYTIPYLEENLPKDKFEIHFVGGGDPPESLNKFREKTFIKLRGRVYPPDDEFLSSNILVVPTPITLGIRVRIITAFSFGTCVVAHHANSAGIPELNSGENCILTNSPLEMGQAIINIYNKKDFQHKLESNAKELFNCYFSESTASKNIISFLKI